MARIAFLGLGAMGLPMAKRLCAAGHSLNVVVHSNPVPAKEIEALGGTVAGSCAEAVRGVDIVISILPEDKQIEETLLDPGTMRAVSAKTILVEMSTATPGMMKRLAAEYARQGVKCFDAPVSGGTAGAANGGLTIMGGGEESVLEAIRPVLDVLAKKIFLVGGPGAGKAIKAVNQLITAATTMAVAEGVALAKSEGIDTGVLFDVLSASSANSYVLANKFKKIADNDYSGGFKLRLMKKDIRIAMEGAEPLSMPVSSLTYQLFKMPGQDDQDADYSVIAELFRR